VAGEMRHATGERMCGQGALGGAKAHAYTIDFQLPRPGKDAERCSHVRPNGVTFSDELGGGL